MRCIEYRKVLSLYLDGTMSGKQMRQVEQHLSECGSCHRNHALLRQTQRAVATLGRAPAPPDLPLRLRVALSREMLHSRQSRWEGLRMRWHNACNAFMVPATAGAVSAVLIFGLLIGLFAVPPQLSASGSDVPTWLYKPPVFVYTPFDVEVGGFNSEAIVVQVYIGANGRVQDYRILSAPSDMRGYEPQLNQMLIFSEFRPAIAFGRPTLGSMVLSFSKVNVQG